MKKLFFTAIALVAFSFVSMANNGIVIKKNLVDVKTEKKEVVLKAETPCADAASVLMNYLINEMNNTFDQAWRLSQIAYNHCMANTYGN